jgi:hypothetical protein
MICGVINNIDGDETRER